MEIGKLLKIVGILLMISGSIVGYSLWPNKDEYKTSKISAPSILLPTITNAYKVQKNYTLYSIICGIVSGLFFIGFAELIESNSIIADA